MASPSPLLDCGLDLEVFSLVMAFLYFLLFIPAILLNVVTAYISWKLKTNSSFIVYLKSLVVADLLMTLLILLMGLISLDRFFKIVKPGGRRLGHSVLFGRVAVTVVFTFLLSVNTLPNMIFNSEKPSNNTAELCMSLKSDLGKRYHAAVSIECNVIFLVVSVIIGFCYTCIAKRVIGSYRNSGSTDIKGRQKIKARLFIILAVFLVCFAPYHITRFPYVWRQVENKINCHWASLKVAKSITLWLATANICLDPLIYILLCKTFRKKFYELKILEYWSSSTAQVNVQQAIF